jgi:hypothetical protein
VVDTRQIGDGILDCRNWAVVTNNTFQTSGLNAIYADGAHLTPRGYVNYFGPAITSTLDALWPTN